VAPELEYFYFADSGPEPKVLDRGGYFDLTPLDVAQEYRRKTINALEQMGIPVEHSHHEVAPSQHEIIVRYTDALTMADNIMSFRLAVKEVALEHGIYATFMPKPLENHDGSGMHLHLSLFKDDENIFAEPTTRRAVGHRQGVRGRSAPPLPRDHRRHQPVGQLLQAAGGGLRGPHLRDLGAQQPVRPGAGAVGQTGKPESVRVEYRSPDSAANPYLALSVLLAAGLEGVAQGYELPPEAPGNVFELSSRERQALGIERLPETLAQALDVMESSELVRKALGDHVFNWFLRNKRKEWERYQHHVSRFELETYLPVL
jgi:glutamine synthetase